MDDLTERLSNELSKDFRRDFLNGTRYFSGICIAVGLDIASSPYFIAGGGVIAAGVLIRYTIGLTEDQLNMED